MFTLGWLDLSMLSLPQRIVCCVETSVLSLSMLRWITHVWLLDLFGSGHIVKSLCPSFMGAVPKKSWLQNEIRFIQNTSQNSRYEHPVTKIKESKYKVVCSDSQAWFNYFNLKGKETTKITSFLAFRLWIPGKEEVKHWLLQWKFLCFPQCRNFHKEPFCVIERNIFRSRLTTP